MLSVAGSKTKEEESIILKSLELSRKGVQGMSWEGIMPLSSVQPGLEKSFMHFRC